MENAFESLNLSSNLSAELKNVQGETRSDRKRKQRVVSNCWDHLTKITSVGQRRQNATKKKKTFPETLP